MNKFFNKIYIYIHDKVYPTKRSPIEIYFSQSVFSFWSILLAIQLYIHHLCVYFYYWNVFFYYLLFHII